MSKKAELDQLQEVVKQQPGSRTYAILAQRYLEEGALDEAMRICRAGFEANPDFEEGAVTYLAGLRQARDFETAEIVYRSALSRHPGSASLRVAWAVILLDGRREPEARRLAREAVELDPNNDEAGELLASLGEARPGPEDRKALVRPWVRPVGQRTSATSLFDLSTPSPPSPSRPITDERMLFDATPMPMNPVKRPESPRSPLIGTPSAPGVPPPPEDGAAVHQPGFGDEGTDTRVDSALSELFEPDEAPEDKPDPGAERDLFPRGPTGEQLGIGHAPTEKVPSLEQAAAAPASPAPGKPEPADAPLRVAQLAPDDQGSVSVMMPRPQRPRRRWIWLLTLIPVLFAGVAIGYYYLRHHRRQALIARVGEILEATRPDRKADYEQARRDLGVLITERGREPLLEGANALIGAHLTARFGTGPREQVIALLGSAEAKATVPGRIAAALLDRGDRAAMAKRIEGLTGPVGGWHLRYVRFLLVGDSDQAQRLLDAERKLPTPATAILLEGAHLARVRGDTRATAALLAAAAKTSPEHPGLRIERALLAIEQRQPPPTAKQLKQLADLAEDAAPLRAQVALLIGYAARNAGRNDEAVAVARKAARLAPNSLEAGWLAAIWQLAPQGDVAAAHEAIVAARPAFEKLRSEAVLWEAYALLQLGRPHKAQALLSRAPAAKFTSEMRSWRSAIAVRCADALGAREKVRALCSGRDKSLAPRARLACIEALLRYADLKAAAKLAQRFGKRTAIGRYVTGLRALARGDASLAIGPLTRAHQQIGTRVTNLHAAPFPPPASPLFALAEAAIHHNRLGRAVELLRRAVEVDAGSANARCRLAQGLAAIGHDSEARSLVDETLTKLAPDGPRALAGLGGVLLHLGLPDRARELLRRSAGSPTAAMALFAGQVALADGKAKEASEHFAEALRLDPRSAEAMVALAQVVGSRRARRLIASAVKIRPRDPRLQLLLAETYTRLKRYKKALRAGKKAIERYLRSKQRGRANEAMVTLGRAFARSGDRWAVARAEELLFEACKSKDAPAIAFYVLATVYRAQKDHKRTIWCLRKATALDPKLAVAYRDLGFALRTKPKWRGRARRAFRDYLRLSPKAADAAKIRALIRRR